MTWLVKAWRKANELNSAIENLGYFNTPYFEIAGDIAESIYYMLDEKTQTFDESVTSQILNGKRTDEECAEMLLAEYCKSVPHRSDHVNESIAETAKQMGISIPAMINVILCEWALQRDLLANRIRLMADK